jgi:chitinase
MKVLTHTDWEYPGAKDRGGSDKDGVNYTALLKELREAITASGRDYIVTFTAPTSYWYLRHFDIKNMSEHVDWINLMSYDLHGVWDGDNPIGKHVLSHTNLTEIDLALDLVSEPWISVRSRPLRVALVLAC